MSETATLLVSCPDQKGLVSGISTFIFKNGGNILQSDQYTDVEAGIFLARFEFHLTGFQVPADQIAEHFRPLAREFAMNFELHLSGHKPKVALLASRLPISSRRIPTPRRSDRRALSPACPRIRHELRTPSQRPQTQSRTVRLPAA